MHPHHHSHDHAQQLISPQGRADRRLFIALGLTLAFALVEGLAGWYAGSLALFGDAGHMLTDSLALGIAAMAAALSRRPPTERLSYGFARSKALAAFANALLMLVLIAVLLWQAILRLTESRVVDADTVTVVALVGLVINLVVAFMLSRGSGDINTRGALLHVVGDLLGSVAALMSGLLIKLTGWMPIDALLAMLIAGLIAASALSLLRSAMHTLMNGVPRSLSLTEVGRTLAEQPGVAGVHDLHIWELEEGHVALSAHVLVRDMSSWPDLLQRLQSTANTRFGITHLTLQPEPMETAALQFMSAGAPRHSADESHKHATRR